MTELALSEGRLTAEGLDRYERDLQALTRVLAVIPKRGPRAYVGQEAMSLSAGLAALREGGLRGVQVRYLHEDREWWDTLLPAQGEFRLVRIDHGAVVGQPTRG